MRVGSVLMLGLLLAFALIFGYWIGTPHQLSARWNAADHHLEQLNVAGD